MKNKDAFRWFLLVLLSLIWGSSFTLIKRGLEGFGATEAATLRLMAAGLIMLPFAGSQLRKVAWRSIPAILMASMMSMVVPAYLFCLAQQNVQSSVAGMLNALTPAFTFLWSLVFFKSRYHYMQIAGLLLGLLSAVSLVFVRSHGGLQFDAYSLLIVLATACYGLNINFVKARLSGIPSLSLSILTVSFAGLIAFFLVFLPGYRHYSLASGNVEPLMSLVLLGVLGTATAQVIQNRLISTSSALFASMSTYIIPVVAIFWGVSDGETFHFGHAAGITGILISIVLIRVDQPFWRGLVCRLHRQIDRLKFN